MRKNDLEEIRAVIHRVRAEQFPHVAISFLDAVLGAEAGALDDDVDAVRRIRDAIATSSSDGGLA